MINQPVLPYAGTSGHSGSETSRERAIQADKSGQTQQRQDMVWKLLRRNEGIGATWKDVAEFFGWHHGTCSGALSILHKAGRINRLKETRDGCKVYVLPAYVYGRTIEKHGGKRESRKDLIQEIQAFASHYSHTVDGRQVVILDQLIDFLRRV